MQTLPVLADPIRRRMAERLAPRHRLAGETNAASHLTPPAISQPRNVLRDAARMKGRADGQRRIRSLEVQRLGKLERWLERARRAWSRRLDAGERELRKETHRNRT